MPILCTNLSIAKPLAYFVMFFEKPDHKYPTQFSEINYKQKKFSLTSSKYSLSVRGPKIWN